MSSIERLQLVDVLTPTIQIQSPSPVPFDKPTFPSSKETKTASSLAAVRLSSPKSYKTAGPLESSRKRSSTTAGVTEKEFDKMVSSRSSRNRSESPSSNSTSPPPKRARAGTKDVDWSEVTDPEERRRIQNRIAQRKFREKAKEQKERAERDSRNREYAGNSYRIPLATDIDTEVELSGLPWGSINLSHVLARGHEAESRRSSGQGTYSADELSSGHYTISHGTGLHQTASFGSSGAEDAYFDDNPYLYDPSIVGQAYPAIS